MHRWTVLTSGSCPTSSWAHTVIFNHKIRFAFNAMPSQRLFRTRFFFNVHILIVELCSCSHNGELSPFIFVRDTFYRQLCNHLTLLGSQLHMGFSFNMRQHRQFFQPVIATKFTVDSVPLAIKHKVQISKTVQLTQCPHICVDGVCNKKPMNTHILFSKLHSSHVFIQYIKSRIKH